MITCGGIFIAEIVDGAVVAAPDVADPLSPDDPLLASPLAVEDDPDAVEETMRIIIVSKLDVHDVFR